MAWVRATFFLLCLWTAPCWAPDPLAGCWVVSGQVRGDFEIIQSNVKPTYVTSPNYYKLVDGTRFESEPLKIPFHLYGGLSEGGVLSASITASERRPGKPGENGKEYRAAWDAKEEFKKMMDHFGDRVRILEATWVSGTNLDHFNRAIEMRRAAKPGEVPKLDEAVWDTWNGQQMRDVYKFEYAEVVKADYDAATGKYKTLVVKFHRKKP